MASPLRPETVAFALAVAVLGWGFVDLPPAERAVVTALAVGLFLVASAAIERLRRRYLGESLE